MVSRTIEVRVQHLRISLLKVVFPGGHHIVVGGRLLSTTKDGVTTPHEDMPEYTPKMFPVSLEVWGDGKYPDVYVLHVKGKYNHKLGEVRAHALLFNAADKQDVVAWLLSQAPK